jgi:hypothetical protein
MKYEYMKESEQMLQYFQFPKFLLKLRISQTAKFLYMILYDRARISRMNSWIDKYGNVPLKEIKSETMLDKRRIYDRILEMCTPMYVGGASKREAIASMKMEKAKTLLNTNRGEEECE